MTEKLTGQTCESFISDGRLAQVEHLQFVKMFTNQLQASIAKLSHHRIEYWITFKLVKKNIPFSNT